jgi:hypothetical protein
MTRTHLKHYRAYINGVDMSGYSRTIGALAWMFDAEPDAAFTDECKNILVGKGDIQAGVLNAFLDNDTAGLFANQASVTRNLMVAIGANAAPVAGNPVFAWKFEDTGYKSDQGSGFVAASLPFGGASYASTLTYKKPWGVLLAPLLARTAANTAVGIDDFGASPPSLGGIFIYHATTSNGTFTLTAEEADTNLDGSFAAITGATSGSITAAVTPQHGMVALSTTAAIKRYLRFQLTLGTATTVTFTSAFIRNNLA